MEHIYFQRTFGKVTDVDVERCTSLCGMAVGSDSEERWGIWLCNALKGNKGALEYYYDYVACDICEFMLFSLRECYEKSFAE